MRERESAQLETTRFGGVIVGSAQRDELAPLVDREPDLAGGSPIGPPRERLFERVESTVTQPMHQSVTDGTLRSWGRELCGIGSARQLVDDGARDFAQRAIDGTERRIELECPPS